MPLNNETKAYEAVQKNVAVSIAIVNSTEIHGITIESIHTAQSGYNNVTMKSTNTELVTSEAIANIFLPPTLFRQMSSKVNRISSFIYNNAKLFLTSDNSSKPDVINSRVMSASFKDLRISGLSPEDELRSSFSPIDRNLTGSSNCAFWNFTAASTFPSIFLSFELILVPFNVDGRGVRFLRRMTLKKINCC